MSVIDTAVSQRLAGPRDTVTIMRHTQRPTQPGRALSFVSSVNVATVEGVVRCAIRTVSETAVLNFRAY